jgi:hypothetical protein
LGINLGKVIYKLTEAAKEKFDIQLSVELDALANCHIIFGIVNIVFIENDTEILHANYTRKEAFNNLIHKQSIQIKL